MADGKECKCAAHSESECGCNADWTPQELIDARAEIERLRLTDEEREAIAWAINKTAQAYDDPEGGPIKREAMRGLLQRTK